MMILIVGSGFLGQYILRQANAASLVATYKEHPFEAPEGVRTLACDVANKNDVANLAHVCGGNELTVFYLASCHNVDRVFTHPDEARKVNVDALERFLEVFPNIKRLFYASSDCVYGEGAGRAAFKETDDTDPVNVYGRQKSEAERLVLTAGFNVVRLPYMLGASLNSRPHFYDKLVSDLRKGTPVDMIDGMTRSVLSYSDVAGILVRLAEKTDVPQILNIAGDRGFTKYEMGLQISQKLGFSTELVRKISPADAKKLFRDRRAESAVMDNSLLKTVLGTDKIEWRVCS